MIGWRPDVTCWAPEQADLLIPAEAEALSHELFQATHVPLQLRRVPATHPTATGGERVAEAEVLDQLLRRLKPGGRVTDIFPILGASGAGKSHLVRWLRNELYAREDLSDVRFVFVPKHRTSLRGVITSIMAAFEDVEEISELRDRLLAARDESLSALELRARTRDALANGLQFHADRTEVQSELEEQTRNYLSDSLPAILRDPHFGPRYIADGRAIARLVDEKLSGRRGDDALDHAFNFSGEDVAISVDDVSHAALASRGVAEQLVSDPEVTSEYTLSGFAARMLNDQLPGAIKEVFGIGGEDLRELFVEVRRILSGRQDIALLVEDFAMFQGLQAGLVDAITVASSVSEPLCHLITVVAVTTGYYNDEIPDTLKTRASAAFVVDEQGPDAPAQFASTYLRAMRLRTAGAERVDDGARSCDGCPVLDDCHSSFGEFEGEGLFPFNRVFLERAIDARLAGDFNARLFLTQVLRPVLVDEYESVRAQQHPSEELADAFDARQFEPAGDALMRLRSQEEGDRRTRLALLYKDPVDEGDLSTAVHAAFGLPPLGQVGTAVTCAEPGCDQAVLRQGRCADHAEEEEPGEGRQRAPELVEAIDAWKRGVGIAQRHRTAIRQLVTKAVASRIDFADGAFRASAWDHTAGVTPRFDLSPQARSIVIDGNRRQVTGYVELELASADPDTIDAFQALAWLAAERSWLKVPNGVVRAARLERMLSAWAADVQSRLGLRAPVDEELAASATALELLAGLAGSGPVPKRNSGRLVRLRSGESGSADRWPTAMDTVNALEKERTLLREFLDRRLAYAQGNGAPMAYDAVGVRRLFATMRNSTLDGGDSGTPVGKALKTVAARLAGLEAWGQQLMAELPDLSVLGGEAPLTLMEDLDKVARRGQVSADARKAARDAARAVQENDVRVVEEARATIERWSDLSPAERAAVAGAEWHGAAQRLRDFISKAEALIGQATPDAVRTDSSERPAVESGWGAALSDMNRLVADLRKVLR